MDKLTRFRSAGMPLLLTLSVLALLPGCGGSSNGTSAPATGLQGNLVQITEGPLPTSPVTTIALVGDQITVLSADGAQTVATAISGAAGSFQVNLPPGVYQVEASQLPINTLETVTVPTTGYGQITVTSYRLLP